MEAADIRVGNLGVEQSPLRTVSEDLRIGWSAGSVKGENLQASGCISLSAALSIALIATGARPGYFAAATPDPC